MSSPRPVSTTRPDSSATKLRSLHSLLSGVVLVLLAHSACQYSRLTQLKWELSWTQRQTEERATRLALERVQGRGQEMVRTGQWLEQYYQSEQGLNRPEGLLTPDRRQPDFEGIAEWMFNVYLTARVGGASEPQAREAVMDAIRRTDEWRQKHPGASDDGRPRPLP